MAAVSVRIHENYPFSLSLKLILALLILTGICFIAFGILFIWYKRKTSLASSMVGNLNKLIPTLTEKKPALKSLLPILSELKFPESNQNKNIVTFTAVSRLIQITSGWTNITTYIGSSVFKWKPSNPKMSTPSKSTDTKSEPLSLELFNCAAADLDQKGEIKLEKYKKYLFNRDWWIPLYNLLLMVWTWSLLQILAGNGHSIPDLLFVNILTEKCANWSRNHIQSYGTCLILVANIGSKSGLYKTVWYRTWLISQLLHFTCF